MRKDVLVGVLVGGALLLLGVPFTLLGTVLQEKVTAKELAEPTVTARYEAADAPGRSVLFPGNHRLSPGKARDIGCAGRAVARGAVDFGLTPVRVEVTGVAGRTVTVDEIRARKVRSTAARPGVVLSCQHQGSSEITTAALELDDPAPRALKFLEPRGTVDVFVSDKPYFQETTHYVERGKPEVFVVSGIARTRSTEWVVEVVGTVDGKQRVWTLDDNGRPFRTAAALDDARYRVFLVTPSHSAETDYLPRLPPRCPPTCE
ncbi:hypothetical protein [Streptomyces sp. CA-132043]|uniref:hypothetical protein n=1 Tax=Streptomyces sp. CA-132043 TaxID=3240048 RepID=UPI003D8A3369